MISSTTAAQIPEEYLHLQTIVFKTRSVLMNGTACYEWKWVILACKEIVFVLLWIHMSLKDAGKRICDKFPETAAIKAIILVRCTEKCVFTRTKVVKRNTGKKLMVFFVFAKEVLTVFATKMSWKLHTGGNSFGSFEPRHHLELVLYRCKMLVSC